MSTSTALLDPYSLRARLQPALLSLAPALIAVFALVPEAWEPARSLLVTFGGFGGTLLLSHIARDTGKRIEPRLYLEWGGKPSVAMLRHRDNRLNTATKQRYHLVLSEALGLALPTVEAETQEPARADAAYESANAWLLARSRDTAAFRVLFAENISYGFRRNFLALRPWAIAISIVGAAVIASARVWSWPVAIANPRLALAAIVALAVYAVVIVFVVNASWVKHAAEAYAARLLEATDQLVPIRNEN